MYLKEKLTIRKVRQTRKKAGNETTLFTDLVRQREYRNLWLDADFLFQIKRTRQI